MSGSQQTFHTVCYVLFSANLLYCLLCLVLQPYHCLYIFCIFVVADIVSVLVYFMHLVAFVTTQQVLLQDFMITLFHRLKFVTGLSTNGRKVLPDAFDHCRHICNPFICNVFTLVLCTTYKLFESFMAVLDDYCSM